MKTNVFLSFAIGVIITFTSCTNGKKTEKTESNESKISVTLSVDELMANAEANIGKDVTVEGLCTHLCAHGAGKMFLMGSDESQIIRIQASEEIGAFKQECVNSMVEATGVLVETKIDEEYLLEWEAQLNEQEKEHHGEGEGGCTSEKNARGEQGNTMNERIADFRTRIAERSEKEGKAYLSFYHIDGVTYSIQE